MLMAIAILLAIAAIATGCGRRLAGAANDASPLRMRLMTSQQYIQTIAYIFGSDIGESVAAPMPPFSRTNGLLATGAASIGVTSDQLQRIQLAAATVAAKVVDEKHREFLIPCRPASATAADAACARQFLGSVGRLWFRRPLDKERLERFVSLAGSTADRQSDFYLGLANVLEGMLLSPDALFIIDRAQPDPEHAGRRQLDPYSLAARWSFFLWNAAPDSALLQAAENGDLATAAGRERAVARLLASARLTEGMRALFDDMLGLSDFDALSKDPAIYPAVTGATLRDAREQTLLTVIDHLLTRRQDYRDLFTTRNTFMSMDLAAVYGVPAIDRWVPYQFREDSHRAGLLTHVSFLAAHAHPARSSPTRRGKALREVFLCEKVPAPPPDVDFSKLDDPDPSLRTARERLLIHSTNPSCAGCHKLMDPVGLALEHFDGAGAYRAHEQGAPLVVNGALDEKTFDDVDGLNRVLHDHPRVPACLVNRVYAYGTGGAVSPAADARVLKSLTKQFASSGYELPALLREIVLSDAFINVREPRRPLPASSKGSGAMPPAAGAGTADVAFRDLGRSR